MSQISGNRVDVLSLMQMQFEGRFKTFGMGFIAIVKDRQLIIPVDVRNSFQNASGRPDRVVPSAADPRGRGGGDDRVHAQPPRPLPGRDGGYGVSKSFLEPCFHSL